MNYMRAQDRRTDRVQCVVWPRIGRAASQPDYQTDTTLSRVFVPSNYEELSRRLHLSRHIYSW